MTAGYEEFKRKLLSGSSSSGLPFWGDDPDSWDRVVLAGRTAPGLAKVTGETKNRVDRKTIPGTNGQTYTHIGYEPAEVNIELRVWLPEHLTELAELVALIRPRRGAPQPVAISHPSTALYGIRSILVITASLPERDDLTDSYKVKIVGREYVPSGNKKGKVATAKRDYDLTTIPEALGEEVQRQKAAAKPSAQNAKSPTGG